jgi:hypothetical protein
MGGCVRAVLTEVIGTVGINKDFEVVVLEYHLWARQVNARR